jgi:2-keto-3-deoxy-L-rhamnonate aldolase RhmA
MAMDNRPMQIGFWLGLPSPEIAEIVGGTGFDFVIIDLEHGIISMETAQRMLMALAASGTVPMIRVPDPTESWIKHALDAGAHAVMVPRIDSPAAAARLAAFATYGPDGRRGWGVGVARAARWGRDSEGYLGGWRKRGGLILQIESPEGLAAAAEIAAVPGVTQLFFGPADFAASLGTGQDDPRVLAAARTVVAAARAAGREAGSVTFPGADLAVLADMGCTHALDGSDISLLVRGVDGHLAAARREAARAEG